MTNEAPATVAESTISNEKLAHGLAVALVRQAYPLRPLQPGTGEEVPFDLLPMPAGFVAGWERARSVALSMGLDYANGIAAQLAGGVS